MTTAQTAKQTDPGYFPEDVEEELRWLSTVAVEWSRTRDTPAIEEPSLELVLDGEFFRFRQEVELSPDDGYRFFDNGFARYAVDMVPVAIMHFHPHVDFYMPGMLVFRTVITDAGDGLVLADPTGRVLDVYPPFVPVPVP